MLKEKQQWIHICTQGHIKTQSSIYAFPNNDHIFYHYHNQDIMGELEECGWKKAEEKKEAEVCTSIAFRKCLLHKTCFVQ